MNLVGDMHVSIVVNLLLSLGACVSHEVVENYLWGGLTYLKSSKSIFWGICTREIGKYIPFVIIFIFLFIYLFIYYRLMVHIITTIVYTCRQNFCKDI